MNLRRVLLPLVLASSLILAACASDDPGSEATAPAGADDMRTIEVEMVDLAFQPDEIDLTAGESVRFVFTNSGALPHDAFIGDQAAQDHHAEEMAQGDGHAHAEEDANAVTVQPGGTAELVYTFAEAGQMLIGCHEPGHYEAGMVATITIA